MADKRKDNGGHSTKAKRPDDKRLNQAKRLLDKYIKENVDDEKFKALMDRLYNDAINGDNKATTIYLNYVLGMPKQTADISSNGESINNPVIIFGKTNSNK